MAKQNELVLVALGDIILGEDSEGYMAGVKDPLKEADIRIGQLEVPYTSRSEVFEGLSREPWRLSPLADCMDILTLAGNHIYDAKEEGIEDTIEWLDSHGLLHAGGGNNLDEARKPALIEKKGCRIGVLNYNCTGPMATHAGEHKAGCAYIKVITKYELGDVANPGGPPEKIYTFPELESMEWMCEDIKQLKKECDVVVVYFHKGIVHKPVKLADYESVVSHAAIDAGASLVLSSHSHILHGIEFYKGKAIFHGLGNGVAWVPSLSPNYKFEENTKKNDVFDPKGWAEKRIERFGFVPDPEYPTYPFHPEAVNTILAKCVIRDNEVSEIRCIPAIVGRDGVTRTVERKNGGEEVFGYLDSITKRAGLNAGYRWEENEIVAEEIETIAEERK